MGRMPPPPSPAGLRVSEFYERKRRLAYHFAWLSMVLLLVQLATGDVLELYSNPRTAPAGSSICVLHRCLTQNEADGSRLLLFDPALKLQAEPLRLLDTATAVLPEGRELSVFYGSTGSVLTDLKTSRPIDLGQKWSVLAAVADPARETAWIFGWTDGKIVARRRDKAVWSPDVEVAKSGLVERLSASIEPGAGPQIAWVEKNQTKVRTARSDGQAWAPHAEFEIGDALLWDAVLAQGRTLVTTYHRDDRTFEFVTFRLQCCPGCPSPAASRKIAFTDPVLLVGRKVTGMSLIVTGDQLRFFLTRPYTIMSASVPLATLQPAPPGVRLTGLTVDSGWRKIVGSITPLLLIFCSISMVFIGVTLFRERSRAALQILSPDPGPAVSPVSARTMAYLLDAFLLIPVAMILQDYVEVTEITDPRFIWVAGPLWCTEICYRFLMEWRFGWTFGKRILGMKVTAIDGTRLTFRAALIRNLARIIDGQVPFGVILGVALMLRSQRRQRLGDLMGRTMVIQDL